jgi:Zn-dependent peptidase ImmA (M78 family)
LLHEARLPEPTADMQARPRDSRAAYLARIAANTDSERLQAWQAWARRHAVRACAEGGIVPDVFIYRAGDDIEFAWGHHPVPGGEDATFVTEPGIAHAPVDDVGKTLDAALTWFTGLIPLHRTSWFEALQASEAKRRGDSPETRLRWFLDGGNAGSDASLTNTLLNKSEPTREWLQQFGTQPWLAPLAPEVAMFGALSPEIDRTASLNLLRVLSEAHTNIQPTSPDPTAELGESLPAWQVSYPWLQGYELAQEVLEEADPNPNLGWTDVEGILNKLDICVREDAFSENGPRGVAIAGFSYTPTVVVNSDKSVNKTEPGKRFTLAHELCHILYDRDRARSVFHSSTPWAQPAVEQRANAFAAMLLMPPERLDFPERGTPVADLPQYVRETRDKLRVGRVALIRHLANLNLIGEFERDQLLA